MTSPFGFPRTVDEHSARLVATGVVVQAVAWQATQWPILLVTLTLGFAARVATGPRWSPLGQFVTRIATPFLTNRLRWTPKIVSGPPKRFAQAIGLAFSGAASVSWLAGNTTLAATIIGVLIIAASLEAALGLCLGCKAFALLMRVGLVPADVCADCYDLSAYWERRGLSPATNP